MEGLKIWGEGNQSNLAIIGMLLMINVIASNAVGVEPRLAACISNGPENPSEGKLVGRLYFSFVTCRNFGYSPSKMASFI